MNLSAFIARRYLISRKSNNAINIISWISVTAIGVTTAALVIILSAMNGLTDVVAGLYNAMEPDLKITARHSKFFKDDSTLLARIQQVEGVKTVARVLVENAMVKREDRQDIVTIKGVDANFKVITRFDTVVREGSYVLRDGPQRYAIVGRGVAARLSVNINDFTTPISIWAPKRGKFEGVNPEEAFNTLNIKPAGIFSLNDDFDFKYIFIDLKEAQELFDSPGEISSLEIACTNPSHAKRVQQDLQTLFGKDYTIKDRQQLNDLLFKTLETEKLWTFLILIFILVIATFNIIGALTMLIIEKKKDIQTFYHLGADSRFVRSIFMRQGLLISAIGALGGLILGLFVCWLQLQFHLIRFDEQYVISYYPIKLEWTDLFWILFAVLLIGFVAALYPVRVFTRSNLATPRLRPE